MSEVSKSIYRTREDAVVPPPPQLWGGQLVWVPCTVNPGQLDTV